MKIYGFIITYKFIAPKLKNLDISAVEPTNTIGIQIIVSDTTEIPDPTDQSVVNSSDDILTHARRLYGQAMMGEPAATQLLFPHKEWNNRSCFWREKHRKLLRKLEVYQDH